MDLAFFKELGEKVEVQRGEVIVRTVSHEKIDYLFLLEEGIASLASLTRKGERQTFQYFTEPGFLNLVPFLTRERLGFENEQEVTVVAQTDCVVRKIASSVVREQLSHSGVLSFFLDTVLRDYVFVMNKQRDGNDGSAMVNLCRFFLTYSYEKNGKRHLHKSFSYAEIASFLQIHEVSVARLVKELKEEGLIAKQGHEIVLKDLDHLAQWAAGNTDA